MRPTSGHGGWSYTSRGGGAKPTLMTTSARDDAAETRPIAKTSKNQRNGRSSFMHFLLFKARGPGRNAVASRCQLKHAAGIEVASCRPGCLPSVNPVVSLVCREMLYPLHMEFFVSELEREPVEFDQDLAPGAIDFGDLAEQEGVLASSGRAE